MRVRELSPEAIWNHFADLNAVPRPSKNEGRVIEFMMEFGRSLGLETVKDAIGNVVIKKAATPGMENRKTVILQSHLDMVHQKNAGTNFDFDTEGIKMLVDNDWVRAEGTTLGADNGIGVATIMAVLSSDSIVHPAIEAMFTIDEETGMTGAKELDPKNFSGEILLNLDTEDDDELSIGCAGGIDTNSEKGYTTEEIKPESMIYRISVSGLLGGHSGMDIILGRGNANKLLNRILLHLNKNLKFQLIEFDGGGLRNAIPREAFAFIAVDNDLDGQLEMEFGTIMTELKAEFQSIEKEMNLSLSPSNHDSSTAVSDRELQLILRTIAAVHNGVFRMSPEIEGLVETSSSLARVVVSNGKFVTQSLQRSSIESGKNEVATAIRSTLELAGCNVVQSGDYPGWRPNPDSEILRLMRSLYTKKFNEEPQVKACHAGLECGILSKHLPGVDMISFGPNIRGAHSPDECVQVSSVQKFWDYFLEALEQTPVKN